MTEPVKKTDEELLAELNKAHHVVVPPVVPPAPEPKVEVKVTPVVEKSEKEQMHDKIVAILKEHDMKESTIGLNHEYWSLVNRFRSMK